TRRSSELSVCENWEGTHNTLQMQIRRDMQKYGVHEGFFAYLDSLLSACSSQDGPQVQIVRDAIAKSQRALASLAQLQPGAATLAMRPQLDQLSWLLYATIRLWERAKLAECTPLDDASIQQSIAHHQCPEPDYSDPSVLLRITAVVQDL